MRLVVRDGNVVLTVFSSVKLTLSGVHLNHFSLTSTRAACWMLDGTLGGRLNTTVVSSVGVTGEVTGLPCSPQTSHESLAGMAVYQLNQLSIHHKLNFSNVSYFATCFTDTLP